MQKYIGSVDSFLNHYSSTYMLITLLEEPFTCEIGWFCIITLVFDKRLEKNTIFITILLGTHLTFCWVRFYFIMR